MKTPASLLALPLLTLVGGCNATEPAPATTVVETSNTVIVNTSPTQAVNATPRPTVGKAKSSTVAAKNASTKATPAKGTPPKATRLQASASKDADAKPDPAYRVVDESATAPPEASAALKKLQVPPPPLTPKAADKTRVTVTTSKGNIVVEVNGKEAPLHAKSWLYLAKKGFYNNTKFHRYEPGFVIQGGDPLTKLPELEPFYGTGGPGYQIPRERNALTHDAMVLAAARTQDPNSAGSQFYFTLVPTPFLDQGDGYTVFGKVVTGQNVVLNLRAGDTLKSIAVE